MHIHVLHATIYTPVYKHYQTCICTCMYTHVHAPIYMPVYRTHRLDTSHLWGIYLYMYPDIYTYTHSIHACTYTIHSTQTYICIYTHTTQRIDAPEHMHMDNDSMCLHACIYISTCMYVDTCMCILTYVYAHACMYIGRALSVYVW